MTRSNARARDYETVRTVVNVPIEVEVEVDVTDPNRVTFASAEVSGTLSDDRLLRVVREQSRTVMAELNKRRGGLGNA